MGSLGTALYRKLTARRELEVSFIRLTDTAVVPVYATDGAAGMDLVADERHVIVPLERQLVKTNIAIELPEGYEAQVRPRSGLALKHGITVLNSPGTIDSDYRGGIGVILQNTGAFSFEVRPGDRIAQLVVAPVSRVQHREKRVVTETKRGKGGFGSTGFKTGGLVPQIPVMTVDGALLRDNDRRAEGWHEDDLPTFLTRARNGA